jgi:hypothetical protein
VPNSVFETDAWVRRTRPRLAQTYYGLPPAQSMRSFLTASTRGQDRASICLLTAMPCTVAARGSRMRMSSVVSVTEVAAAFSMRRPRVRVPWMGSTARMMRLQDSLGIFARRDSAPRLEDNRC